MAESHTLPNQIITKMLDVIEALAPEQEAIWSHCILREFNIGYPDKARKDEDGTVTCGWALLHALEHAYLHLGHLQLTCQMWRQGGEVQRIGTGSAPPLARIHSPPAGFGAIGKMPRDNTWSVVFQRDATDDRLSSERKVSILAFVRGVKGQHNIFFGYASREQTCRNGLV